MCQGNLENLLDAFVIPPGFLFMMPHEFRCFDNILMLSV